MSRFSLIALFLIAAALFAPSAGATTLDLSPANGNWLATTSGEPCCQYINNVGQAWEAANPGWNSSVTYNTSSWVTYTGANGGWYPTNGSTSDFYARELVDITGTVTAASFLATVDDDVQVWVNGTMVLNDANGGCCNVTPVNIAAYLTLGENVIAVKANNNQGGYSASFSGSVTETDPVPEPASMTLMGTGLAVIGVLRRRRQVR